MQMKLFFCRSKDSKENPEEKFVEEKIMKNYRSKKRKKTWTDIENWDYFLIIIWLWMTCTKKENFPWFSYKKMLVWRKDIKVKLQKCVYKLSTGNLLKERKLLRTTLIREIKKNNLKNSRLCSSSFQLILF